MRTHAGRVLLVQDRMRSENALDATRVSPSLRTPHPATLSLMNPDMIAHRLVEFFPKDMVPEPAGEKFWIDIHAEFTHGSHLILVHRFIEEISSMHQGIFNGADSDGQVANYSYYFGHEENRRQFVMHLGQHITLDDGSFIPLRYTSHSD